MSQKALWFVAALFVLLAVVVPVVHDIYYSIPFEPYTCKNAQGHSPLPECNR
jgi:hypothetical protein